MIFEKESSLITLPSWSRERRDGDFSENYLKFICKVFFFFFFDNEKNWITCK